MEWLLLRFYGWEDLLLTALILYGIYALLFVLRSQLRRARQREGWRPRAYNAVSAVLLLYEPITVLLLALVFVFINPLLHGSLLLVVLLAGFNRLRDYLSGRVVLFTPLIEEGRRMQADGTSGVISQIGRIGLYLQTEEGLHFINYTRLLTRGYLLPGDREIGGYYQFALTPPPDDTEPGEADRLLLDRLTTVPYLNRGFRPEITKTSDESGMLRVRLGVHEERHLSELADLLREWGYGVDNK